MNDDGQQTLTHVRIAARQGVMKGLNRDSLAQAFVQEAMKLAFGATDEEALRLAQAWRVQAFRMLNADYIDHDANGEPHPVRLLRAESRRELMENTALKTAAR
jgi:uncharacterized protein YggE